MSSVLYGNVQVPTSGDVFDVPADMAKLATDLRPLVRPWYASDAAADSALTGKVAGQPARINGKNKVWTGSVWAFTEPYGASVNCGFGTGAVANPGSNFTDSANVLTLPFMHAGRRIHCELEAYITVDGTGPQTVRLDIATTQLTRFTPATDYDRMIPADTAANYRYMSRNFELQANGSSNGTVQFSMTAGGGPQRLVCLFAVVRVTVF